MSLPDLSPTNATMAVEKAIRKGMAGMINIPTALSRDERFKMFRGWLLKQKDWKIHTSHKHNRKVYVHGRWVHLYQVVFHIPHGKKKISKTWHLNGIELESLMSKTKMVLE